jgi:hypothetical protein
LAPPAPCCSCLREIRAAVAHEKPLILVHESDPTKGGAPLKELKEMCPADLRHAIFSEPKAQKLSKGSFNNEGSEDEPPTARLVVPWHRLVAFQLESLRQIAEVTLLHSPRYKSFLTKVCMRARQGAGATAQCSSSHLGDAAACM